MSLRVGIVGAGVLGRLLASRLARNGQQVEVFDAAPHADAPLATGWVAAGMLSPLAELECGNHEVYTLGMRSLALWSRWLPALAQTVPFAAEGSLLLAFPQDRGSAERILQQLKHKAPDWQTPPTLSKTELHALEPALAPQLMGWPLSTEGYLHPTLAMQALWADAQQHGARAHWGCTVHATKPGQVQLEHETRPFDWVFDTRGLGARTDLPLRGVRGEIFTLHAPGVVLTRPLRLLHPRYRVYLVPRAGEHIMVGASELESEDRSPPSLRSTVELLSAAHSVIPALAEARVIAAHSHLRPALPDNLPVLQQQAGLTHINGLFRHGWLLAPALVEQAITHLAQEHAA
ncbi:FAD-dependent oxidoreductase [Leeia aquatica]|uniref:FAD-dependent oxidoreductase n=1 Tax=Leeia aquatica TaxID=2725557 RepID=A0A847S3Q6_9NEIS|nr:FAD-dependent oxidoreductase [Leeia aquatica]NLR73797.1 FAD-dependent oxidoreductase [Leeia aquatica]